MSLLDDAAEAAQDAFWAVVADYFPDATSLDVPPYIMEGFHFACVQAIGFWTAANVPNPPKVTLERPKCPGCLQDHA